jgi:microsomal dipeptidase-like Zn-dependent dipeptidase
MGDPTQHDPALLERARALHKKGPPIDGHNDLPWKYRETVNYALSRLDISQPQPELHADIQRLREGGVGGQFWSVYVSTDLSPDEYVRATMEQIDFVYKMLARYPETFQLALTADEVVQAFKDGKVASLIGIGSDFDGITSAPVGLEDVSTYPMLTAELIRREYSDEDILKILGGNVPRVMREAEGAAQRPQQRRGPSEATIEALDGS